MLSSKFKHGVALAAALLPLHQAVAQESVASFHQDCNYGGYGVSLGEGSYDTPALIARGIRNDDLSSLRIFNGYKVTLYAEPDFSGKSVSYTRNDACLFDAGWNDTVSSLKVEKIPVTTSGNPVFPGWYADPEAAVFGDR